MSERWRFVVGRTIVVVLLVGYFPPDTIQGTVNDDQQERCITSSNKAGYCMPKAQCHDQEIFDLRTLQSCSNVSQYCCPIVADTSPSWSRRKQFTECDSNRGYCVASGMCSVRTFRLRSNRCPTFEEVCCPKNAFPPEKSIATTESARIATTTTTESPTSTSTVASTSTTTRQAVTPTTTTVKSTDYPTTTTTTITAGLDGGDAWSSSNGSKINGLSETAPTTESFGPEGITVVEPNEENDPTDSNNDTNLQENSVLTISASGPPPNLSDSNNTHNTSSSLLSEFTPDSFTYHECGHRNPFGVVEHTINEEFRAEYGEFPWMVALFELPEMRYCCNGALIDSNLVLTTAHCITHCGGQAAQLVVRVGEWNMSSSEETILPREDIGVRSAHIHTGYVPSSLINNIAVLEMNESVQYQATVQPVCLPPAEQLRSSENMMATGWGAMVGLDTAYTPILKRLDLQRVETSICKQELKKGHSPFKFTLHQSFVCVSVNHPDQERPCDGDAGSPVVVEIPDTIDRYYLHGLVSWGYGCNQNRIKHTVLTHVASFRPWIEQIIRRLKRDINPRKGVKGLK
ncbi:serine proteinase stubble-like [Anopheles stephensi]|uniref:serine proteinase stubble-like n=1 Tax=Anopheles stephensi TaxID=30069 RepID=UPI00165889E0|nr:serine proteinase stubble-like [Anopheles stephensi]